MQTQVGFVGYRQNRESFQDRLAGCQSAANTAGVTLVVLPQDLDSRRNDLVLTTATANSLTALICADEITFVAVMDCQ